MEAYTSFARVYDTFMEYTTKAYASEKSGRIIWGKY